MLLQIKVSVNKITKSNYEELIELNSPRRRISDKNNFQQIDTGKLSELFKGMLKKKNDSINELARRILLNYYFSQVLLDKGILSI